MIGTKARRISNSSLGWIKFGPRVFKMMWDRELKQASSASLDLGSAIHCALLEPERFKEDYVSIGNVDPVDGKMGDFIRGMHQLKLMKLPGEEFTNEDYELIAKGVGFKIGTERIKASYNDSKYDAYKAALDTSHGKLPVSDQDMRTIEGILYGVQSHKLANELIFGDSLEYHNELTMEGQIQAKHMLLNTVAILDRHMVDHENKVVTFVDLKTTSGSAYLFRESYEKYNYRRQMAFYREHIGQLYPGYTVNCYIVVAQTSYVNHIADILVYEIPADELDLGVKEYTPMLDAVSWHMKHDRWDYPQEYHESHGACQLNPIT